MYAIKDHAGDWVRMRDGKRFTYSSRDLAVLAAMILGKAHRRQYRAVEA